MKRRRLLIVLAGLILCAAGLALWLFLRPAAGREVCTVLYTEGDTLCYVLPDTMEKGPLTAAGNPAEADTKGNIYYLENGSLYLRDTAKPMEADGAVMTLAADVKKFQALPSGGVLYELATGALFLHDLEKPIWIADSVQDYLASPDGRRLYFREGGMINYKELTSDAQRVQMGEGDVLSEGMASSDFGTLYYLKNGTVIKQSPGGAAAELSVPGKAEDVCIMDGRVYITADSTRTLTAADYVEDDLKEADAALTEPVYPEEDVSKKPQYPNIRDYWDSQFNLDVDGYYADVDKYKAEIAEYDRARQLLLETYEEEKKAYLEKQKRDELRKELADTPLTVSARTLYLYENGATETVSEDVAAVYNDRANLAGRNAGTGAEGILYAAYGTEATVKQKLSTITSAADVRTDRTIASYRIAVGKNSSEVYRRGEGGGSFERPTLSFSENELYFLAGGTLYKVTYKSDGTAVRTELDTGADDYAAAAGKCAWRKGAGLYFEGENVSKSVASFRVLADGRLLYLAADGELYLAGQGAAPKLLSEEVDTIY